MNNLCSPTTFVSGASIFIWFWELSNAFPACVWKKSATSCCMNGVFINIFCITLVSIILPMFVVWEFPTLTCRSWPTIKDISLPAWSCMFLGALSKIFPFPSKWMALPPASFISSDLLSSFRITEMPLRVLRLLILLFEPPPPPVVPLNRLPIT